MKNCGRDYARMFQTRVVLLVLLALGLLVGRGVPGENLRLSDDEPLRLPPVGAYQLRILNPKLLELTLVTTQGAGAPAQPHWDFVSQNGTAALPAPKDFAVSCAGKLVPVAKVGFRRRVIYAPLKHRDLRIGNYLYVQLAEPVAEDQLVQVTNPDHKLWGQGVQFETRSERLRWSPVVHVNQTGYLPAFPKKAMVGYYLGSLGEMKLDGFAAKTNAGPMFQLLDAKSKQMLFQAPLVPRPDRGFPFECYQQILEADFSSITNSGEYQLYVPGLGTSFPFRIDEAVTGAFARTYALGLYHQRCGTDNSLPFTRFTHGPCHTAPAEVPTMSSRFEFVNECLAKMSADFKDNPRHTAPQLKSVAASLYPFVNTKPVDVRGGHHDAGDYSKYTINSAAFIHHLVFAADCFPGVGSLDNLGLPESGDGKSDILQEAKWEADFLAKMQDADGGFYFLVYPREREYEDNVLPDQGDPQVVFPKNTAATAAAVAALAQCASSPRFKQQFPDASALYLEKAKKGWQFLERAITKYGKDGSYQKITHYGNEFMHDDELCWAACELYLATGDAGYHEKLLGWFHPADPETRRWGWWRLYEAYGCAIRSYAFAARTGRLKRAQVNTHLLEECENEIIEAGQDQLQRARACAYGTSFPEEGKRMMSAGWYFSEDAAFDLAVACQLDYPIRRDPRPHFLEALISNVNYEQGCNPVNVTYLTGMGWKRQREIVSQYAENDRRVLPPTGIPLGNVQAAFGWNYTYEKQLDALSFPSDGAQAAPYPFYDRWGDVFNLSQEFVILNQARALGCLAWLMAGTSLTNQNWKATAGEITGWPPKGATGGAALELHAPGMDGAQARTVWEADGLLDPVFGPTFKCVPGKEGAHWVEAEAQWPDGRRVFGVSQQ